MRRLSTVLALVGWVGLFPGGAVWAGAVSGVDPMRAAQVKAAYIRHLVEFTRWPAAAFTNEVAPIRIGVLGDDPHGMAANLQEAVVALRLTVQGRPLLVERFPDQLSAESARGLCVLLVTRSGGSALAAARPLLLGRPTLLVGEEEALLNAGCMVTFVVTNDAQEASVPKVKLAVRLKEAERVGLKLSSQLLRMKQVVRMVE